MCRWSGSFGYFHFETVEDQLLDVPGISASAGGVTSVVFGPSIHDSVDADDGVIDGSGLAGDSFYSPAGAGSSVTFSAYGPGDVLLFTETHSGFANTSNSGETADDRFFGVVNSAGVSAVFVSNSSGGIDVDHLQYGAAAAVPEPQTYALMLAGLVAGASVAWRRRS